MNRNYDFVTLNYDVNELISCLPNLEELQNPFGIARYTCNELERKKIQNLFQFSWDVRHVGVFKLFPKSVGIIHIDSNIRHPLFAYAAALNISFGRTEETYMSWYEQIDSSKGVFDYENNRDGTPIMPPHEAIKTERINVAKPHVVKIDKWHSIDNDSPDGISYILSIRFHIKYNYQDLLSMVQSMNGPA